MALKNGAPLNWIHISDLHIGCSNQSQEVALSSLVASIKDYLGDKKIDAVFMTGDLAYSGLQEEYETLSRTLIEPLKRIEGIRSAEFYATPGNHDLDCRAGYPPVWKELGPKRQDQFFHSGKVGKDIRGGRMGGFKSYHEFCKSHSIKTVNPVEEPVEVFGLSTFDSVKVVSVVTSFFSDTQITDQRKSPAPIVALRFAFSKISNDSEIIVLGHHPLEWFSSETEQSLRSLLLQRNAIYLHGHEHKVRPNFGQRGLVTLGIGAAYQASQDSSAESQYKNSFTVCEKREKLHVAVRSWDPGHGNWRAEVNLPGDFSDRSEFLADAFALNISTSLLSDSLRPHAALAHAIRPEQRIQEFLWLVHDSPQKWSSLLKDVGILRGETVAHALRSSPNPVGHDQFRVKDLSGQYLIRAISAAGDVLNQEQVQMFNTELDRQDYTGGFIITLGEIPQSTRTLVNQISLKKQLTLLDREDIIRDLERILPASLDASLSRNMSGRSVTATMVFSDHDINILLCENPTSAGFVVLDSSGAQLPESSEIVNAVRAEVAALLKAPYGLKGGGQGDLTESKFDRSAYLNKSLEYFDNVKYAPLAALGFRFKSASLSSIYVEPSAHGGDSSKRSLALAGALKEFVESLNLTLDQREQLELQLRSKYGVSGSTEVGAARVLYQRFNNVLVLGDPGSGKTCFVKHEILAYCSRDRDEEGWYSRHLPIYISLAEAARVVGPDVSLLDACSILAARRGADLPRAVIDMELTSGTAAMFFDGLDEVAHLEKRIALLQEIGVLTAKYARRGCRFVVASRPAALFPVDVPAELKKLQLNGLTQQEIRQLATRVVGSRAGGNPDNLAPEEEAIIDRLLSDVDGKPGIARMARNPLLLTLLVLIYANSGSLIARRHVVYTQAIKTLTSIRGKETRGQQVSEADLRARLGAVALAILHRQIAEIPEREEVVDVLVRAMASVAPEPERRRAADGFLQEIAEATGIVSIHAGDSDLDGQYVTFMHYSFLEYYAAVGLLNGNGLDELRGFLTNPRLRDIVTLLIGLLSERSDITDVLRRLVESPDQWHKVTESPLLLALDCLVECDVAPEACQEMMGAVIARSISHGAARFSSDLRVEIAERLGPLFEATGQKFLGSIAKGLSDSSSGTRAAFIDLLARVDPEVSLPRELREAFQDCLTIDDSLVRASAMFALSQRSELHDAKAIGAMRVAMRGSAAEKIAALKVALVSKGMSHQAQVEVREALNDKNTAVSDLAAQCVVRDAVSDEKGVRVSDVLEVALRRLDESGADVDSVASMGITVDKQQLVSMLDSSSVETRLLAIRFVPWVRDDDQWAYRVLSNAISLERSHFEIASALNSLRVSPRVAGLITIGDTDKVCSLTVHENRRVRLAALRLLGELPDDEQVIKTLLSRVSPGSRTTNPQETVETARALAKQTRRNERLSGEVLSAVLSLLPSEASEGFGDESRQQSIESLLLACETVGGVVADESSWKLYRLGTDYRTPLAIRRLCLRVFGRVVSPSEGAAEAIVGLLRLPDPRMADARYSAAFFFVTHCKQKSDSVRKVSSKLSQLRDTLVSCWESERAIALDDINSIKMSFLRDSVIAVVDLMVSYEEFAVRANLSKHKKA